MTKPAEKRELPLSPEAWQARPFEAAPPPKRARRPIALWITLGLAALLAIAAGVQTARLSSAKGDLADQRAITSEVRDDLAAAGTNLDAAQSDLGDAQATVSSCLNAVNGLENAQTGALTP